MSKKKFTPRRRSADERPLFGPYHSVHKTKKDKANSRQNRKLETKKMWRDL